jgi:ribonuclease-3
MGRAAVDTQIGYRFRDASLLDRALTHRSSGAIHNERLEFLGDGVLNCAVAAELYRRFPALPEGELSRLRAHLVNQQTLAGLAAQLDLGVSLKLGEGEQRSGGAQRPSILADAVEALLGAVFLDGGFDAACGVVGRLYAELLEQADPLVLGKDAKTRLQEWLQARRLALPQYAVIATRGEAHAQTFEIECRVPSLEVRTTGSGSSRRSAEQAAASAAYEQVLARG